MPRMVYRPTKSIPFFSHAEKLIVFTDLDGTLLDHTTYSYEPATLAVSALQACGVPIIMTTSKTAEEIAVLQDDMGLCAPAITENGAGVWVPDAYQTVAIDMDEMNSGAVQYPDIRAFLTNLEPSLREKFFGFGDMSLQEVVACTGLSQQQARSAKQRQWSEPGVWTGDAASLKMFRVKLNEAGMIAHQGGRFLTLSAEGGKHVLMCKLLKAYQKASGDLGASQQKILKTLALGDAPNDIGMLQKADIGVVLPGVKGREMVGIEDGAEGCIWHAEQPGPEGWNDAVLAALKLFPRYHGSLDAAINKEDKI